MKKSHDFTVFNDGEWRVSYNGQYYGPYETQGIALRAARMAAALKAASVGWDSQILVQGNDGELRSDWEYVTRAMEMVARTVRQP